MPAVSTQRFNVVEWSQNLHKGKLLPEINLLVQKNPMVVDIPFMMCNDGTTHLYSNTTALPAVSKTAAGEGTPMSRSARAQDREVCTMLSGFSSIETEPAKIGGQQGAIMAREDGLFAEALRQQFGRSLIYDNRATGLKDMNGMAMRLPSLSGTKARNILSCGGSTSNAQTSIYIANWGDGLYGIFPDGTTAGYSKEPIGKQAVTLANGNRMICWEVMHRWHIGLCNPDWTSLVRICNIDVAHAAALSNNQAPTSFQNVLHQFLIGINRIRNPGKKIAYCHDRVHELFMRIALEKSNNAVTIQEAATQFGTFQELRVWGVPVRKTDSILLTEAVVS